MDSQTQDGKCIAGLVLICAQCALAASPSNPSVRFDDATQALGLAVTGESACWADFDNDGWVDLCAGGSVWRNVSGKHFTKFTPADFGRAIAADFDNDGFTDLFSFSQMKLWRNDGHGGFTEVALPPLPKTVARGACWADFNGDGFVDLYIGGYEDWDANLTYPSLVLTNAGGKRFSLAHTDRRYRARGVSACDFNRDGYMDVYVSNYRLMPNLLLLGNPQHELILLR